MDYTGAIFIALEWFCGSLRHWERLGMGWVYFKSRLQLVTKTSYWRFPRKLTQWWRKLFLGVGKGKWIDYASRTHFPLHVPLSIVDVLHLCRLCSDPNLRPSFAQLIEALEPLQRLTIPPQEDWRSTICFLTTHCTARVSTRPCQQVMLWFFNCELDVLFICLMLPNNCGS